MSQEDRRTTPHPTRLARLRGALVYVGAMLVVLELISRVALSLPPVMRRLRGLDEAQRLGWVREHKRDHGLGYSFDVYDSLLGWKSRPGLRAERVFGDKILNTNSRGVRGATEYPEAKPAGTHRVILLGDSFTFGDEVSDWDTYAAQLDSLLPGWDVINLGVHGYGHDQMLLALREAGMRYSPDVVILGYVWFDMTRSISSFQPFAKPRFRLERDSLRLTGTPVPSPEMVLASEWKHSRLVDLVDLTWQSLRTASGARQREAEILATRLLDEVARVARAGGATPVLVYLPVLGEMNVADTALTANERFYASYCAGRAVRCLDLRPAFRPWLARGVVFDTVHHWDPASNRIAAEAIATFLRDTGLAALPAPDSSEAPRVAKR